VQIMVYFWLTGCFLWSGCWLSTCITVYIMVLADADNSEIPEVKVLPECPGNTDTEGKI